MPVYTGQPHTGQRTADRSQLKQIAVALDIYVSDHDDSYPCVADFDLISPTIKGYAAKKDIFTSKNPLETHYAFFTPLVGRKRSSINDLSKVPMVYNAVGWPNHTRNVAFANSSARRIDESDFPQICFDAAAQFGSARK